jgi:hypothetical protein
MRFSLRTLALAIAGASAFLGIMIKLYIERPEVFQVVAIVLGTVVPYFFAVGTIFMLAVRSRRVPVCAHCQKRLDDLEYEKTSCPGCNADLSQSMAITLAPRSRTRYGLLAIGLVFLITPAAGFFAAYVIVPSGKPIKALTNRRLIEDRLPPGIDQPWVWNELEQRVKAGRLSRTEVNMILSELVTHLHGSQANPSLRSLPWQRKFLQEASQAQLIDPHVAVNLCDAYHAPVMPKLSLQRNRLDAGWADVTLWIRSQIIRQFDELGVELKWEIKEIRIAGQAMVPAMQRKIGEQWMVCFNRLQLFTGDHSIEVDLLCEYVPTKPMTANQISKMAAPQSSKPLKTWTHKLTETLHIDPPYGSDLKEPTPP